MTYDEELKCRTTFPRTSPALEALKVVAAARVARDIALAAFVQAERDLYDAEEELKATRLLAPKFNNRYSK